MYSSQTIQQQHAARAQAVCRYRRKNLNAATRPRLDLIATIALIIALAGASLAAFWHQDPGAQAGKIQAKSELSKAELKIITAQLEPRHGRR